MCRLLGFVSTHPITLAGLLGSELEGFVELSKAQHRDGWGLAWPEDDGAPGERVSVEKDPEAAWASPAFTKSVADCSTDALLVHLRRATLGLSVDSENTHPFTDGRVAFAHNGSISPPESIDPLIPARLQGRQHGTTDSERLFWVLAGYLGSDDAPAPAGEELADAVAKALAQVTSRLEYSSVNCLLLTPTAMVAVCQYRPDRISEGDPADYYEMRYRITPGAVLVASSGWPQEGWTLLENGSMLVVERPSCRTSVVSLAVDP